MVDKSELFPQPTRPITATIYPGWTFREILFKINSSSLDFRDDESNANS